MRAWWEVIEDAARQTEDYVNILRGGASEREALKYAVRCLRDDVAGDVHREMLGESNPVALTEGTARLALLTTYLTWEPVR